MRYDGLCRSSVASGLSRAIPRRIRGSGPKVTNVDFLRRNPDDSQCRDSISEARKRACPLCAFLVLAARSGLGCRSSLGPTGKQIVRRQFLWTCSSKF